MKTTNSNALFILELKAGVSRWDWLWICDLTREISKISWSKRPSASLGSRRRKNPFRSILLSMVKNKSKSSRSSDAESATLTASNSGQTVTSGDLAPPSSANGAHQKRKPSTSQMNQVRSQNAYVLINSSHYYLSYQTQCQRTNDKRKLSTLKYGRYGPFFS